MNRRAMLFVLVGMTAATTAARPPESAVKEFRIEDAWGRDTVEFRTSAPLEEIVGTSNRVVGVLKADPQHLQTAATAARIEVLLESFKTGIGMRDGHVAKALGAEKNPKAVFTLESVRSVSRESLEPNAGVDLIGSGTLQLNGVSRSLPVTARITYVPSGGPFSKMRPGNLLKIVAQFDVPLEEFGVQRKGPIMELQVSPTAHVTVTALGSDATPHEREKYRQSAEQYLGKAVN